MALRGTEIVGHILFTRVVVRGQEAEHPALALAPLAVLPGEQRRGVGTALVRWGIDEASRLGHSLVIVLGHADYYPRFGFVPASRHGIRAPFPVREANSHRPATTSEGTRGSAARARPRLPGTLA